MFDDGAVPNMMGGLMELGMIIIAGFIFVYFGVPFFNWIANKFKRK